MRSPEEVTARWKELSRLSDLTAALRLATKVPMSPEAVSRRLRQVEALRRTCLAFAKRLGDEERTPSSSPVVLGGRLRDR